MSKVVWSSTKPVIVQRYMCFDIPLASSFLSTDPDTCITLLFFLVLRARKILNTIQQNVCYFTEYDVNDLFATDNCISIKIKLIDGLSHDTSGLSWLYDKSFSRKDEVEQSNQIGYW